MIELKLITLVTYHQILVDHHYAFSAEMSTLPFEEFIISIIIDNKSSTYNIVDSLYTERQSL